MLNRWKQRARDLRRDTHAVYLASRDPRIPWYTKALAGAVIAYALSPIDLIPDFIPVLGYLDDLLIIPAGIVLISKLIPAEIMAEHRTAASERGASSSRGVAIVVVATWIGLAAVAVVVVGRYVA